MTEHSSFCRQQTDQDSPMALDDNALYPSSCRFLSGRVILDAMECSQPPPHNIFRSETWRQSSSSSPMQTPVQLPSLSSMQTRPSFQPLPLASNKRRMIMEEDDSAIVNEGQSDQVPTKEELRRQRNRVHQHRHKMKQHKRVVDLEDYITKLRAEIQQLQVQRHVVSYGVPTSMSVWSVAAEYFRLFRNGSQDPVMKIVAISTAGTVCKVDCQAQRNFLRATMTADVIGETGHGVDSLLEDWRMISRIHDDIDVQLVRLEYGAEDSLIATTRVKCSINENTIRFAFPGLINDDAEHSLSPLVSRLLGQQLVLHGAVRLEWDSDSNRMISVQNEADMITPMLQLLGSLEDVSRLFECARITPQCKLVVS